MGQGRLVIVLVRTIGATRQVVVLMLMFLYTGVYLYVYVECTEKNGISHLNERAGLSADPGKN